MADISLQNSYAKFLAHFITALRRIPLYPAKHPAVVTSIKSISSVLFEILKNKNALTLSLSPDNKIIIESEPFSDRNIAVEEIMPYLKKLDIENITFNFGVSEKELEELIKLMLLDKAQVQGMGDITGVFQEKGIQHIKIDQYSYIKVDKGKEVVAVTPEISALDKLKSKLKEYLEGRLIKPEDIQAIENEIFALISAEYKEKKKVSLPTKNIFKKFFLSAQNKAEVSLKLKNALIDAGFAAEDVEGVIQKLEEEPLRKPKPRQAGSFGEEAGALRSENEALKADLNRLNGRLEEKITEKQRLDNVIHHMAEGMVVVDPQGKLLMANPVAESLLGISKDDVGKPIKDLVKNEHLLALAKTGIMQKDIELLGPNEDTKRVLKTSSAVVEDSSGNTVGMVTILNDITKQKEVEKIKNNFLSNVSHELRTPLIAIEKSLSLILSKATGEISPDQEQFLSVAERNLKRLTLLINDLLDLSKFEAGKMTLKIEPASIGKIIEEAVRTFDSWAKQKSIKLEAKAPEALPEITADANRIIQVINNLLSNAIKFTPNNGSIAVEAIALPGKDEIEVSVTDTGIGIAKENLAKIFDKFYQVDEIAANGVGGTGIGLSVSKEIVELHGGKIWAESEKSGTKFIFTLPLKKNTNT